jgi:hypothetical protein
MKEAEDRRLKAEGRSGKYVPAGGVSDWIAHRRRIFVQAGWTLQDSDYGLTVIAWKNGIGVPPCVYISKFFKPNREDYMGSLIITAAHMWRKINRHHSVPKEQPLFSMEYIFEVDNGR